MNLVLIIAFIIIILISAFITYNEINSDKIKVEKQKVNNPGIATVGLYVENNNTINNGVQK